MSDLSPLPDPPLHTLTELRLLSTLLNNLGDIPVP